MIKLNPGIYCTLFIIYIYIYIYIKGGGGKEKGQAGPLLEWPRGFQEVKVPRFHDNGTGWW
jgi:hypothetical protein